MSRFYIPLDITRPDSSLRYRRYTNHLLTYLLTYYVTSEMLLLANLLTSTEKTKSKLEMWANAQRDGRPAEHRWRPLFNAAKFS